MEVMKRLRQLSGITGRFVLASVSTLAAALALLLILAAGFLVGALCVVAYVCWPYGEPWRWIQQQGDVPAQEVPLSVAKADEAIRRVFPGISFPGRD